MCYEDRHSCFLGYHLTQQLKRDNVFSMPTIQLDDPKQFDGEPFEVAQRAGEQAAAILSAAVEAIEGLHWAARGAYQTGEFTWQDVLPTPEEFDASPQGR